MSLLPFIRELLGLARPSGRLLVWLIGLTLLEALAAIPTPLLFAWLIDRLLAETAGEIIWLFCGLVLGLELTAAGLRIIRVRANRHFALQSANRLRDRFFAHLIHLPYAHFLEHQAGGQANSHLNDIDDIDTAVGGLVDRGLRSLFLLAALGITLAIWNPVIAACAAVMLPAAILAQRRLRQRVRSSSREKVDLREAITGRVAESVQHAALVKSFALEHHIAGQIDDLAGRYRDTEVVMETSQAALRSSASVLFIATQYAFFVIGAWLVIEGPLAVGAFLGQMALLTRLTGPMNTLLEYGNELARSQAALHRVQEILATPAEGGNETRPISALPVADIDLQISDLRFRFRPDVPVIDGWDLTVAAGETIAIVGPSGSGKTTLFHILLGLHEGYQGTITIAGADHRRCDLPALRRSMGVVFQEQQLFNASIRENLAIGCDEPAELSDAACWDALQQAHAADFVAALADGLDTRIGVDGIALSGGQRQRLAIAQVIVKNPPLLLLDEATSALDSHAEAQVQAALAELCVGRTNLIVAHRLSTVIGADRIVVIDGGRILDDGPHEALLARCERYRQLYDAQVEGFLHWQGEEDADG